MVSGMLIILRGTTQLCVKAIERAKNVCSTHKTVTTSTFSAMNVVNGNARFVHFGEYEIWVWVCVG